MKKNKLLLLISLAIIFIIFNVIAFLIPSEFTASFWVSYIFSIVMFTTILCVICFYSKLKALKKGIIPFSFTYCSTVYVIAEFIVFLLTKFINEFPTWLSLILNVLILGIYTLVFIGIYFVGNNSNSIRENVNKKVFYMKELQVDLKLLLQKETDSKIKKELNKLIEKIRYSDPMSNSVLEPLEKEIKELVEELKTNPHSLEIISRINEKVEERSEKVGMMKWE